MKLKVTEKGVSQEGKDIAVGETITVTGDTVPPSLVNKVVETEGGGVVKDPNPSGAERQARMKVLVDGLDKDKDFIASGAPDVAALNALLNEGETPFTAAERDKLWLGIKPA